MEKDILKNGLDGYFKNRLKASKLPFNIMKIIDLLDEQGSDYNIEEVLAIANVPRKILDKMFNLRTGLTFKTYAGLTELGN
jgi:methylphosphotriester-DNA--protein-cysteine methyltransferase